jgi:hypothetical protein
MDRKQIVADRACDLLGGQLEEVVHLARRDRDELRAWGEPTHLRAALHYTSEESERSAGEGHAAVESAHAEAPSDSSARSGLLAQLLDHGAHGAEKVIAGRSADLTASDLLGMECLLAVYARPAIVAGEQLGAVSPLWAVLGRQRSDVQRAQRAVGRIDLLGHPEYDWAGTGFLAHESCLMTTRRVADAFLEERDGHWRFRPGITAWMDYRSNQRVASAGYRIRGVIGVHDRYDLALLEVEPPEAIRDAPAPLPVAARAPEDLEGRLVYLIGYPVRDARRSEPDDVARLCRDVYNAKRVMPGTLCGMLEFRDIQLVQHDCGLLGQVAGACLVDLHTHQVLGLHTSGRYLEPATAVPLWVLRDDPLLRKAGVVFAEASASDVQRALGQLERLARSRYWPEVQATIARYYEQVFGSGPSADSAETLSGSTEPVGR